MAGGWVTINDHQSFLGCPEDRQRGRAYRTDSPPSPCMSEMKPAPVGGRYLTTPPSPVCNDRTILEGNLKLDEHCRSLSASFVDMKRLFA